MPLKDREKRLEFGRKYRETHREQLKANAREKYKENPYRSRQYPINREKARVRGRTCYQKNRVRIRMEAVKRAYLLKVEVLAYYSLQEYPACAYCGETDIRVLQVDHIEGGGGKHRKQLGISGGRSFYTWLRKCGFPKGYQVLCSNCNIIKDYEMRSLYSGEA